jgi:hypothetical protein
MWPFIAMLTCLLGVTGPAFSLAADFEGSIYSTFKGGETAQAEPMEMRTHVKGNKMRMEMGLQRERGDQPGQTEGMILIHDYQAKKSITLIPLEKTAWVSDIAGGQMLPPDVRAKYTLERTGKTEMIAGYHAEQFISKDLEGEGMTEVWAGQLGISVFGLMSLNEEPSTKLSALERNLMEQGYYPLRLVIHQKDGKTRTVMEVTKVEKKPLSDELFLIPAGYKTMNQTGMLPMA